MWSLKKEPKAPVQTHVVTPAGSRGLPKQVAALSSLRRRPTKSLSGSHLMDDQPPKRGMWVTYKGRTGILTNLEAGDIATVMLVDEAGLNLMEMHLQAAELTQAWYEEIPEGRRPQLGVAVAMGYHRRGA